MAKTVATVIGVVFVLVGLIGFAAHDLMGTHLGTVHNLVHIVSGIVALYFGLKGTLGQARLFCIVFGIVYGLLGVLGFVAGTGADRMLELPAGLMLGTNDHALHIVLGIVFLAAGFLTKAETKHTAAAS